MTQKMIVLALLAVLLFVSAFPMTCSALEGKATKDLSKDDNRVREERGKNGGIPCAACTVLVAVVSQTMEVRNITCQPALNYFCGLMPAPLNSVCKTLVSIVGPVVAPLLESGESADVICNALKLCRRETATCRLFPKKASTKTEDAYREHVRQVVAQYSHVAAFNICTILPVVCRVENHLPAVDLDGDRFSGFETLRGSHWRGKDCNDLDGTVFPGRKSRDATADENCNGIYGTDPVSGRTYEELWCDDTNAMGIAVLGDSATAHFRIPETFLLPMDYNQSTFAHLYRFLEDEADFPMLSWGTGFMDPSSFAHDVSGPMKSIYSNMRNHNRCNHRDYQNLGVNGARVGNLEFFTSLLQRNANAGLALKPVVAIMSMIGNDVCDWRPSFDPMTTPKEYHDSVLEAVIAANAALPKGSHVVLAPLFDGRLLYDSMHSRIHPIGRMHNDVTYTGFYDYLNCLVTSPCWGWLNSNQTVRDLTAQRARELGDQLPLVINETAGRLTNIKVHYMAHLIDETISKIPLEERYRIVEPTDGFHPSQYANSLYGDSLYELLVANNILGPKNIHNDEIISKFGEQGGH